MLLGSGGIPGLLGGVLLSAQALNLTVRAVGIDLQKSHELADIAHLDFGVTFALGAPLKGMHLSLELNHIAMGGFPESVASRAAVEHGADQA